MNDIFRRSLFISVLIVLITFMATIFSTNPVTLELFVTILFYMALPAAMVGLTMFIVKGGFFDFFSYSFKKVSRVLARSSEYQDDTKFDTNFKLSERIDGSYMKSFLYSGVSLTLISIAVAYMM
jgi:hypothetical protein